MQKSSFIILIAFFIIASILYSAYDYFEVRKKAIVDTRNYLEAKAEIRAVYPVMITRYNAKRGSYDIEFTDRSGSKQIRFRCALAGVFKLKDSVSILYDPDNTEAEVILKK